jgi:hypothetical protein
VPQTEHKEVNFDSFESFRLMLIKKMKKT